MSLPTGAGVAQEFLSAYPYPVTPRRKSHTPDNVGGSLLLFGCGSYGLMTRQDENNVTTPTLTTALQTWNTLVFGTVHAVATTTDGAVYTWGENLNGQLGLGDTKTRTTPTVVSALDTRLITNVGAGFAHSLFVSSNGAVLAAGSGEYGQTGINEQSLRPRHEANYDYNDHYTPAPCRSLRDIRITRVVCGERHSLALSSYGDVYGCGEASQGALGLEEGRTWTRERTFVILFTRIPGLAMIPIVGIAAGSHHSLAVTASGSAYSWGNSKNGKTGLGTTSICYTPKRIESLSSHIITSVHGGDSHSAFLSDSGALFMSGANNFGQLGTGDREPCLIPTRVAALMEHLIIQVACGSNHSLAVTSTHDVYAWGSADQGQLGIEGEVKSRTLPTQITTHELLKQGRPILAIAAGADTSAIIISHHTNQPPIQPSHRLALPSSFDRHHYTQLLTTATSTHDYTNIMSYISSVWSNPQALNASFMNRKGTGITFDLLEHVYKSILRIATHESRMSTVLISAIQKSLNTLVQHMEKGHLDDPLSYRVIPIILQVPLLSMGSAREMQLLVDVAVVVRRMSQQARQQLIKWWSTMPPEVFASRLVKMMTHTLDLKLEQQRRALGGSRIRVIPEDVISIIELLELLYQSNAQTRLVPDSIFYMDGVQHVDFAHVTNQISVYIKCGYGSDAEMDVRCSRWDGWMFYDNVLILPDYMTWRTVPPTKAQLPPFSFCRYPFLLHPVVKSEILRIENSFVQQHEMISSVMSQQQPYLVMEVRRDHLVDDVVRCINAHSPVELRLPLKVRFVGEEGIDQGGVSREFFTLLFSQLLDPKYALFAYNTETRTYWFNHSEPDNPSKRDLFYVAGLLLGMSLYNAVSINVSFPSIMYRLLLRGTATLEDFIQADPEAGRSLEQILAYEGNVEEAFGLTFEVMSPIDTKPNGSDVSTYNTVELIQNGANISVTNENRQQYVKLYVEYVLYGSVRAQLTAFTSGFHHLCRGHALSLLTPKDLELFITGEQQLNFHDLEKTTRYEGGYSPQHPTIQQFWSVLHNDLALEDKKQLLVFVTGSARVPLGGLGELRMCIQRAEGDTERLPSAHTCFHTFLLPEYSSRDKLVSKIKLALQHSIGFGMR